MDTERNKRNVRRVFEEGFSLGRLDVVDECLAADARDRHDFDPETPDFRSHLRYIISLLRAGMPDLTATVDDIVAEGDRVAVRVTMTGTHTGAPVFGVEPRGAAVRVEQFHFVQCNDDGQGVAHWASVGENDMLAQMQTVPVG
jgi:predicted ester cyclase